MSDCQHNQSVNSSKQIQAKNYHSKPCLNPDCEIKNGKQGKWRNDTGLKGGGKGWCSKCLKKDEKILRDASGHECYICKLCPSNIEKLIRKNKKGYEACEKLSLCAPCFNMQAKDDSQKVLILSEDQQNIFDQTAAESEADHAEEDTRCQSSLLTSHGN